jgi:hypothetical protein
MRKVTVSDILTLPALILSLSGCSHIAHRADINEGLNMSGFVTPDYETYDPPETARFEEDRSDGLVHYARTDFQVFLGYGWRVKDDAKLMIYCNMAGTVLKTSEALPMASAGLYYQGTPSDSPYDMGFGALIGPDPLFYALWGRDFGGANPEDKKYGIDIGGGFGLIPSVLLHLKISRDLGRFRLGFMSEYRRFWGALDTHYEQSDFDDYILSQLYFGIILIPEFP